MKNKNNGSQNQGKLYSIPPNLFFFFLSFPNFPLWTTLFSVDSLLAFLLLGIAQVVVLRHRRGPGPLQSHLGGHEPRVPWALKLL